MQNNYSLKIGLFGIGLDAYWEQFDGLKERLEGYLNIVENNLINKGCGVSDVGSPSKSHIPHAICINAGLVDTIDKAFAAGKLFRTEDVDLIFLYVTTYALSSTVLPVVQRANVPVIILNLAPEAAINYAHFVIV